MSCCVRPATRSDTAHMAMPPPLLQQPLYVSSTLANRPTIFSLRCAAKDRDSRPPLTQPRALRHTTVLSNIMSL